MNYREKTLLARRVFSNTPDPSFFCESRGHVKCLENLSLSIGLRRGLSVVVGGVGTGKTTLCRRLIKMMAEDERIVTHLILDPYFRDRRDFLAAIHEKLHGVRPSPEMDERRLKEAIKRHLYIQGVEKNKIVVLFIDEGQKLSGFCLEILRELLNLETNSYKLLQIVIAVQGECNQRTGLRANLADRIDFFGCLGPFDFQETKAMIRQRIEMAFQGSPGFHFFTTAAFWEIYRITGGYPRQIINLCHKCFLDMLAWNRRKITRSMVRSCARIGSETRKTKNGWHMMPALTGLLLVLIGLNALVGAGLGPGEPERVQVPVKIEAPVSLVDNMRQKYAEEVLENESGRVRVASHLHHESGQSLQIQSSSWSMGVNPRRMVFSVTQTGSMN